MSDIKTTLTSKEIRQMIDSAPCLRDKVALQILADTGVRVSELLRLKEENVDTHKGVVLIPHLKVGIRKKCPGCGRAAGRRQGFCSRCGASLSNVQAEGEQDKRRLVNIGKGTCKLIEQYLAEREAANERPEDGRLIPVTRQSIYKVVREAAESIGIIGKDILNPETGKNHYVHPHSFRDSIAVDWLGQAGNDIGLQKALQEHLGHSRFETTMRYNKLQPSEVKKASDAIRRIRFGEDG